MRIMLYFYFNTYLFSSHPKPLKIVTQLLSDYGLVEELFHVKRINDIRELYFHFNIYLIIVHSKVFNDEIFLAFLKRVKRVSSCLDNKGNYSRRAKDLLIHWHFWIQTQKKLLFRTYYCKVLIV